MANPRWSPKQKSTAQVDTITIGVYDVTTTYTATIGNKSYSTLGTGGTNATTAAALQAILAASTEPEFLEITWTVNSNVITATAVTPGTPFTLSASVNGGTGTISHATTTANTSPNDVNDALNWSTGAVPTTGDNVYIDNTDVSLLWNLTALAGVNVALLNISLSFTGNIGLPEQNRNGTEYTEYRPLYWQIAPTVINIGQNPGTGSGRIKLDTTSVQTLLNQYASGGAIDTDKPAVMWKGTHASNALNIVGGSFGAAVGGQDEVATAATVRQANAATDVRLGAGCTLTTVNIEDGTTLVESNVTTLNKYGGTLTLSGGGTIGTMNNLAGATVCQSTGTITTLNVGTGSSFDLSQDIRAITLSNVNLYGGSTLLDTAFRATYSNGVQLVNCFLGDVTINLGSNRKLTPS